MTKTNFNPQIKNIEMASKPSGESQAPPVSQAITTFDHKPADAWKSLVSGTPTEIGPMVDALRGEEKVRKLGWRERVQSFLSGFTFGNRKATSSSDVPTVPSVDRLIQNPSIFNNVGPIVDRFVALEKTYMLLLDTAQRSITPRLSPSEARTRQDQLQETKEGLIAVRAELKKARYYHAWQKLREAEARKKAEDNPQSIRHA
ncbi:MAG: hypothetical protein HY540_05455 [Deltaproteobacteria bacterium]|nr:hypothetical protein [Deltaproteobacteria bacterium]